MKRFVLILNAVFVGIAIVSTSAKAETIVPSNTQKYVGKSVTVEGNVSEVHHAASGKVTFIDMGGRYPNNTFAGVIFSDDAAKFPDVDSLDGKTVDITGTIKLYQGRPEIILNDLSQLKTK
jgi:DNA/RNA endonuclease YhcR with UshA esterase domain